MSFFEIFLIVVFAQFASTRRPFQKSWDARRSSMLAPRARCVATCSRLHLSSPFRSRGEAGHHPGLPSSHRTLLVRHCGLIKGCAQSHCVSLYSLTCCSCVLYSHC